MKILVCPGSFDPITVGHLEIIKRASKMAEQLIVVILNNSEKKYIFSLDERIKMIKDSTKELKNVKVDFFDGLMVDYLKKVNADAVVRGLRNSIDFEYEFHGATLNKTLYDDFEAVYLFSEPKYSYISSTTVREIGKFHGDISQMVPKEILDFVNNKFLKK